MPFRLRLSFDLIPNCVVLKPILRFILYNKMENNFSSLLGEFSTQQEIFQPQVLVVGGLRMMLNFKGEGECVVTTTFPLMVSCCLTILFQNRAD